MSSYLRSMGFFLAIFFMIMSLFSFISYYREISSVKQDTYKEIMYYGMNRGTLRVDGAGDLYMPCEEEETCDGVSVISEYYDLEALEYEIEKQLAIDSKTNMTLNYDLLYSEEYNAYYLHITSASSTEVDTVIKVELEKGI